MTLNIQNVEHMKQQKQKKVNVRIGREIPGQTLGILVAFSLIKDIWDVTEGEIYDETFKSAVTV